MNKIAKNAARLVLVMSAALQAGCAANADKAVPVEAAIACGQHGTGFTVPPTPSTVQATEAQEAILNSPIEKVYDGVARGDATAQIELGLRYMNGRDVPANQQQGFALFNAAAAQGNPVALYYLGAAYSNGAGVPKAEDKAILLWEESAKQGYPDAQYWLGFMIAHGRGGINSDWCAAASFFEAAAKQDVSDAAFLLGFAHQEGRMGKPDYDKAAYWYRAATKNRTNPKAQYNLRYMIEKYLVTWQPGDPGQPPPPKEQPAGPEMKLKDKAPDTVG